MIAEFTVAVEVTPAIARFNRIAGRFSNFVPLAGGKVDVLVRNMIRRQLDSEGAAFGKPYKALNPDYAKWKRKKYGRKRILVRKGQMREAFVQKKGPSQILTLRKDFYRLAARGQVAKRASMHQYGRGNNPVRQIIPDPLPESFLQELNRAVRSYIIRGET